MMRELSTGFGLRWINNAGFELELAGGAHLLIDPWLDSAQIWPMKAEQLSRADYVLLTHIHFDHADSIGQLQRFFPNARILVGDLSADPLCRMQGLNVEKLYRVRGGEVYEFQDVKVEAISGRHTESRGGSYYGKGNNVKAGGSDDWAMWYGSLEFFNYRLTGRDGSRIAVWGGMTSDEQIARMGHYRDNDIALMHVSPKQDMGQFIELVKAINPKAVIPHHYDLWDVMFRENPAMLQDAPLPPEKMNEKYILGAIRQAVEESCPYTAFFIPEHHRWYRFGLGVRE